MDGYGGASARGGAVGPGLGRQSLCRKERGQGEKKRRSTSGKIQRIWRMNRHRPRRERAVFESQANRDKREKKGKEG